MTEIAVELDSPIEDTPTQMAPLEDTKSQDDPDEEEDEDNDVEEVEEPLEEVVEPMQLKAFKFNVTETKEISKDGINIGVVSGYASTHGNVDRGRDKVMPGAFTKSIQRHSSENRPVRMYYQHDAKEIIGGFPPNLMYEDSEGLKVVGEINLDVQRGREVYALAKQGVLTDFSIGYSVKEFDIKKGVRELKEVDLWEVSVVAEPMNPKAKILQVKEVKQSIKSKRDAEKLLRDSGFSRSASAYIASLIDETKLISADQIEEDVQSNQQRDAVETSNNELVSLLTNLKSLVEKL